VRPVKLLLDENLSPAVAHKLRAEGMDVAHVRDRGILGATDAEVLAKALAEDRILVTSDVDDFALLADAIGLHGGVVLVEDGSLLRDEQEQVVRHAASLILAEYGNGNDMVNRLLRIWLTGTWAFETIP
jgi:predicted nuclease of predicted toxin-antitoxin system